VTSPEVRAARLDAIRRDRAARGLPPTIESPAVYALLAAVLSSSSSSSTGGLDERATA